VFFFISENGAVHLLLFDGLRLFMKELQSLFVLLEFFSMRGKLLTSARIRWNSRCSKEIARCVPSINLSAAVTVHAFSIRLL